MSKNADYWRGRFSIIQDAAQREAGACVADLETIYRDAERTVQADLERWYGRFATNNGISLTDARKMLTTGQMEEFRWTVDQYIQAAQQNNLSPEWIKKLENASARFHVSRLETIQLQIQQQMELLYGGQLDSLDGLLKNVVSNGYTHTAFEIQRGLGLGWDITALNQRKLETLLSRPWTADGKTFRDRCWENKANLVSGVQSTLTQGLLRGDSLQKLTDRIKNQFGVSRYKAGRLAHTETTYFNGVANLEVYRDLGIEQVEILETLDRHTCEICGALDGTVIPLSQYEPGVTVPPFHPNCRGTTCPHYADMKGERAARNADGEVYYVPADTSYQKWLETFVKGGDKAGLVKAVSPQEIKDKISGKQAELQGLQDERRRLLQEMNEAQHGEFQYDWGAKEYEKFANMSDDEFQAYVKSIEQREQAITAEMERLRAQQDAIVFDRNPQAEAQWDALGDQVRALRRERQTVRYELSDLERANEWRTKYGSKGRDFFSSKVSSVQKSIDAVDAKTATLNQEIKALQEELVKAEIVQAEAEFSTKSLEEIKAEILEKHKDLIKTDAQRAEFEKIMDSLDKEHANLYNRLAENFSGSNYYQRGAGWYDPSDLHVHMDLNSHPWDDRVGRNLSAAWKTKFHEEFHQLDHILGTTGDFGGRVRALSSTLTPYGSRMIAAIDQDVLNCVNQAVDWYNAQYGTAYKHIASLKRISGDAKDCFFSWLGQMAPTAKDRALIDTFTDAVGLTTKGNINPYGKGYWGHQFSYQKSRGKDGATSEVWANLGSFLFRGDTEALDALAPFMPNTIQTYSETLDEVLEYAKTHVIKYK